MALADYQPETRVIPFSGGSFSVKGLSLNDFTALVRHHLPDLEAMFNLGSNTLSGKTELTEDDITKLAVAFAEEAPGFVANLIALAAGETDEKSVNAALSLPFPVQVRALAAIADLTFAEVGGIKKAMESVAGLLKQANPETVKKTLTSLRQ